MVCKVLACGPCHRGRGAWLLALGLQPTRPD